jgi:virginiamycin B lyase
MMRLLRGLFSAVFLTLSIAPTYGQAQLKSETGSQIDILEWQVPWPSTRPRDPFVAPDGIVWFCGQAGHYIASFNPETGEMKKYDTGEGTGAHNLIVADDGMVWYSGNRTAHIGRLDPDTGEITRFPMPDPAARDPHTMVWLPDGNIAFTLQGANMVGHLNVTTGEVRLAKAEKESSRPYGIKVGPDGEVWAVLFGTNRIAHFDTKNVALHEFELPDKDARPRRIVITSDGRIWYGDYRRGYLGVFDPRDASFDEFQLPSKVESRPYGMAVDNTDTIWLVETGVRPNQMVAFDTEKETFTRSATIPSGGSSIRHMYFDAQTNSIWFGTDTNYVGRALVGRSEES